MSQKPLEQIKAEMRDFLKVPNISYEDQAQDNITQYWLKLLSDLDPEAKLRRVREKVRGLFTLINPNPKKALLSLYELEQIIDAELKEQKNVKQITNQELFDKIWNYQPKDKDLLIYYRKFVNEISDIILDGEIVPVVDAELEEAKKRFPVGSKFKHRYYENPFTVHSIERYGSSILINKGEWNCFNYKGAKDYMTPLPLEPEWPELELKLKDQIKEKEAEIESLKRQINLAIRNLGRC